MLSMDTPIPLSEIENVLHWVDEHKLSRSTKKIHRDFSDGVLLAEILATHYPKLVEMHNYPPRNSHALKLNNWMTLSRKVLKKLKLNLSYATMEQLANSAPGVIERLLVVVHDRVRRDEELSRAMKESDQNASSGGSYYEATAGEDQWLLVPVKTRVNGALEIVQQKVVSFESHIAVKNELKDTKEGLELLKQKVDHLDQLLKLKEERIDELQKQLERKASRRKDLDIMHNNLILPSELGPDSKTDALNSANKVADKCAEYETRESVSSSTLVSDDNAKVAQQKLMKQEPVILNPDDNVKVAQPKPIKQEPFKSSIPIPKCEERKAKEDKTPTKSKTSINSPHDIPCVYLDKISSQENPPMNKAFVANNNAFNITNDVFVVQAEEKQKLSNHSIRISRIPSLRHDEINKQANYVTDNNVINNLENSDIMADLPSMIMRQVKDDDDKLNNTIEVSLKELAQEREKREELNRVKSDVYKEALDQKASEPLTDIEDYKDSEEDVITINATIRQECEVIQYSLSRSKLVPHVVEAWGTNSPKS